MFGWIAASIRSQSSSNPPAPSASGTSMASAPATRIAAATLGQSGVKTTAESPGPTVAWQARTSATMPLAVTTTSRAGSSSTPWSRAVCSAMARRSGIVPALGV